MDTTIGHTGAPPCAGCAALRQLLADEAQRHGAVVAGLEARVRELEDLIADLLLTGHARAVAPRPETGAARDE